MKKLVKLFLIPWALLWEAYYWLRRYLYTYDFISSTALSLPIISIGNLSFGGSGKTPFTLWLAQYFENANKDVLILMRGYKGALENSRGLLQAGKKLGHNPQIFGDEAVLFSRRLKNASVVVGKKRTENLLHYLDQLRPDVVLLDDGHQHLKLKRSLNIVLFDATMELPRYQVAPLGYLREGLSALKDADAVVIGRVDQVSENQVTELKKMLAPYLSSLIPIAEIIYRPVRLLSTNYQEVYAYADFAVQLKNKKVVALAGIASPDAFFKTLKGLGMDVILEESFPDHHEFKPEEIARLIEKAELEDALVITTEKDIVKIRRLFDSPRILFLEIAIQFVEGEEALLNLVQKTMDVV